MRVQMFVLSDSAGVLHGVTKGMGLGWQLSPILELGGEGVWQSVRMHCLERRHLTRFVPLLVHQTSRSCGQLTCNSIAYSP